MLTAFLIYNSGLGDTIALNGMVHYLASKYKTVFITCIREFYDQIKLFYPNKNIIVFPIDDKMPINMYEFASMMWEFRNIYDLYYIGNYGAIKIDNTTYTKTMRDGSVRKIITNYPLSYYTDFIEQLKVTMPTDYANLKVASGQYNDIDISRYIMTKYFAVTYPIEITNRYDELLATFPKYRVIHQVGSNASVDIINQQHMDINAVLTIDVNKNLYHKTHKFHAISEKFVNLPSMIYYAKLLENASELYLIDSCIHALALVVDIRKAHPRICYRRESRFTYGIPDKFEYFQLVFHETL